MIIVLSISAIRSFFRRSFNSTIFTSISSTDVFFLKAKKDPVLRASLTLKLS